jgi:hypothetical protein
VKPDPENGLVAALNAPLNALPPAPITPAVLAFLLTKTAMIATPTMANKTVTTDAVISDI